MNPRFIALLAVEHLYSGPIPSQGYRKRPGSLPNPSIGVLRWFVVFREYGVACYYGLFSLCVVKTRASFAVLVVT